MQYERDGTKPEKEMLGSYVKKRELKSQLFIGRMGRTYLRRLDHQGPSVLQAAQAMLEKGSPLKRLRWEVSDREDVPPIYNNAEFKTKDPSKLRVYDFEGMGEGYGKETDEGFDQDAYMREIKKRIDGRRRAQRAQ